MAIHQVFKCGGIVVLLADQIDENAWVKVAAARAHDHTAGGGQPHAGVDRHAVADRGEAGAVAEMGDHQTPRHVPCKLTHDRLQERP